MTSPPSVSEGMDRRPSGARRLISAVRAGPRPDAVTVLTVFLVLTYAVPSDLTIAALGGAGSPTALWSLAAGLWWCWYRIAAIRRKSAWRWTVNMSSAVFLLAVIASYTSAALRPISPIELSQADTGLLKALAWVGLVLLTSDGIPDRRRLLVIYRRVVVAGALFAALGLAQFVTGQAIVGNISLPGFASTQGFSSVQDRNGFTRSAATAVNPLEYAMVLCMVLPLALNLALHDTTRSRLQRWWPVVSLAGAASLSVSRSTLLGVAAGIIVLAPTWPPVIRRWALVVTVVGAGALYVLVPGLAGTLVYLFTGISSDSGAVSRTSSYGIASELFARSPVFGRGLGTFLPDYRIFDNQYLLLVVESGAVGVGALLALVATSIRAARVSRRYAPDVIDREIGQALVASMIAGATLIAFFDAFSFPKAGATFFLFVGLCGAHRRLSMDGIDGGSRRRARA